jgi:putative ABC transport system permease protein
MAHRLLRPALRNLTKNKFFSSLNILGLAIGMAIFLLIAQYVYFEKSYEDFIPNRENIYRVSLQASRGSSPFLSTAQHFPATGPAIKKEIAGIERYARLFNLGYRNNVIITNENTGRGEIAVRERKVLVADSSFISMMGYKMLSGDAVTALREPGTAVISQTHAKIFFGNDDPMGKTLRFRDDDLTDKVLTVTGVLEDLPVNTHLKFDMLISLPTTFGKGVDESWGRESLFTYVQLQPGIDPARIEAAITAVINKNKSAAGNYSVHYAGTLQPVSSIHLHSALAEEPEPNGSDNIVFFIGIIGIFVLGIAWINYINLSTARAVNRAKEVGVKKVLGAFRGQLIQQFLAEAAMVNFTSLVLAFGIVLLAWPAFNSLAGLNLGYSYLFQPWYLVLLFVLWTFGSLLSGFYPAWVLSAFRPVTILKGKFRSSSGGILLRKGLVVTQFMASVALIAGTYIVYSQLNYMLKRNIGVDISQVMVLESPGIIPGGRNDSIFNSHVDIFRNGLKSVPSVQSVATSLTIPGKTREYKSFLKVAGPGNDSITARANSMDYEFLDVFKMKLLAGRNFSPELRAENKNAAIVTESAARKLGFQNPADIVGKMITVTENRRTDRLVVGVVNDYHQLSLQNAMEPGWFYCSPRGGQYYSIRINTNNLQQTIGQVEKYWTQAFPGNPFEYFFLDDYFNRQYANEQKFGKLFSSFALFAIIISCLGLFGLSAFMASQRIKEIGIRKILGASVVNIAFMLTKDFLKLVCIAIVIATPVAWMVMDNWLAQFAYSVDITVWIFIGAGMMAILIALLTISFQAIRSAVANPVKSLRTE